MSKRGGKKGGKPDSILIISVFVLALFGLIMLASASSGLGQEKFGDSYYYLKRQALYGLLIGLIGFFIGLKINYHAYKNRYLSLALLLGTIFLLLAVFTPLGLEIKGATRWLEIGGFSFLPAELLKITLVIYLAIWLSAGKERQESIRGGLVPFLVIIGLVAGLLSAQRSTSPVVILIMVSLAMYFMSGAKLRYIAGTIAVGAVAVALLVAVTPYRAQRFLSYLHPEQDPQGSGFHVLQSKMAIGSGGMFGVGYGQSQVKEFLPEPIGDSIFAVIGEEFGFVGVIALIALFAILVLRMFMLSRGLRDQFGKLLLIGFGSIIGIQVFVNIGAMTGLLPITGTPLPFISYGSTTLIVFLTMAGIAANVSTYSKQNS